MKKDAQNMFLKMSNFFWNSDINSAVMTFADAIYTFRVKVDDLVTAKDC